LTGDLQPTYRYLAGDISLVSGWPAADLKVADAWSSHMLDGPIPRESLYRTALDEGSSHHEFDFRRGDGRIARMAIHFRRLDTSPDGSAELVGYIQDVSETRQVMARTVHAARLASLGEMSAALAHELRQPLAIMSFAAENALDDIADGELDPVKERLQRIIDQSHRAGLIIDHLRAFARMEPPDRPLEVIDVRAAIDGALALLGGMIRQAGVQVLIDLDNAITLVRAHPVSLEQVFVNLFLNSVHAMGARPADSPRWIRVSQIPGKTEDTVCFAVSDSGGGISEDVLPRVFEPFVTTKANGDGTGLGLSLCHGIMQGFDGSIGAKNAMEGAVFTLCFPMVETYAT